MIACVPHEKNYYSNKEYKHYFLPQVKTYQLQQLYTAALESLKNAQQGIGLNNILLKLGRKQNFVDIKIPLMFIIGENQGGDSICGRTIFYGKSARRIS